MSVLGKRPITGLDELDANDSLDNLHSHKKRKLNPDNAIPNGGVIMLNVGGIKYQTTIQTLTGYTSMLKARFSSKYAMKQSDDGSYFIDGDGALFRYILKYLRTGALLLPSEWKRSHVWEFYVEIKYFMIESLFNKVLLKLFDSSIVTNDALKLNIINKLGEVLNWDKNTAMESINEWKCLGSLTNFCGTIMEIGHGLALIEANYVTYGLFLTQYTTDEGSTVLYDFDKSFAFTCGSNSRHLLSTSNTENIATSMVYSPVRRLTNDELKVEQQGDKTYKRCIDLSPLQVRGTVTKRDYKSDEIRWFVRYGHGVKHKYKLLRKSELWSIPHKL
eukprot:1068881_1